MELDEYIEFCYFLADSTRRSDGMLTEFSVNPHLGKFFMRISLSTESADGSAIRLTISSDS